jgi:hypothetical protein
MLRPLEVVQELLHPLRLVRILHPLRLVRIWVEALVLLVLLVLLVQEFVLLSFPVLWQELKRLVLV